MNYKQELPWSPLVNPRWPLNLLLGLLPAQDFLEYSIGAFWKPKHGRYMDPSGRHLEHKEPR